MKTKFLWHKPRQSEKIDFGSNELKMSMWTFYQSDALLNRHRHRLNTKKTYKLFTINKLVEKQDQELKRILDKIRGK